jgi:hypothetical protein
MDENLNFNKNSDIDQALKEFEIKSSIEQVQKVPLNEKISEVPKIVQLTMKWFGVKEQRQAEYVLLGFVIVAIAVSLFLFFGGGKDDSVNIQKKFQDKIQFLPK